MTGLKDLLWGSTFVEVRLVKNDEKGDPQEVQIKQTSTVDGNYPDWNETLEF